MKKKLTSRKFWMALAAFIVGVLALFGVNANMAQQISGVIMSLGAVIAYIVGEGLVDAAATNTVTVNAVARGAAPVIGVVQPEPTKPARTAAAEAAEVKQETALSQQ